MKMNTNYLMALSLAAIGCVFELFGSHVANFAYVSAIIFAIKYVK